MNKQFFLINEEDICNSLSEAKKRALYEQQDFGQDGESIVCIAEIVSIKKYKVELALRELKEVE